CEILPEGPISENFVQCTPGRSTVPLRPGAGDLPTVPLDHTSVPFSLQDVLNVFSVPTDQRLQMLISELGIATAGRGEDLNGLLRRSDPMLAQTDRVLGIVNAQRTEIADAISGTDAILAELAARASQTRAFVDEAASVARTTAAHRTALAASVHDLPSM